MSAEKAPRWVLTALVMASAGVLVGIEIATHNFEFRGPTANLLSELIFAPKRGPVLWAGLALSMVGLVPRERLICLGTAAVTDLAFFVGRMSEGGRPTFGNGALLVLVGLGLWAGGRWDGERRINTLKGVGLGLVLIMATKLSDAWLHLTAITQPTVLDEYVQTADHALGDPAWWVGRLVEATGSVGYQVLEFVYIQLPIGAIVVALYQLRKGWPGHHLVRTFLAIGMIGPIFYVLFPVVGPVFAFSGVSGGWAVADVWPSISYLDLTPAPIAFDNVTPRNCMPSLHTAWAVAIFVHSRQGPRWLRAFGTFWMICTLTATLGFGYHYGVDLIAGVVFSLTIESALRDPERGWGWFRSRLVLGGSLVMAGLLLSFRYLSVPLATVPEVAGPILLVVLAGVIAAFYATFFARPGTALAAWGQRNAQHAASANSWAHERLTPTDATGPRSDGSRRSQAP